MKCLLDNKNGLVKYAMLDLGQYHSESATKVTPKFMMIFLDLDHWVSELFWDNKNGAT